ncbi:ABC transporter permease [Anaeromyxobacter dehalogenans]|uniref:ABC transporter, inner membrane subunit n=1 Tax=Anaeromyxobacter dehalogenans (strain 2CP-C) TaxID=290397 RepID=Q2IH61_ANADE|nr:ABC transporter permease [Anaeromyxobacter dehalogenans]ABC83921.1 ABC transporter, inner membrane subunit [Anaeromyxobacter dehalogenans 2CP-C]
MNAFLDTLAMAIGTLRGNVLRSMLTLLGIVIGACTVVAMMSLTEGLRLKMTTDFAMLGAGAFQVQKWPHMNFGPIDWRKYEQRKPLTREQGEALRSLPHVKFVSIEEYPSGDGNGAAVVSTPERATRREVAFGGVLPDYEPANGVTVGQGRFITTTDVLLGRRVTFVGTDVVDVLFPKMDPIGREVRIRGVPFEIIGVSVKQGSIFGQSKDSWAVVPWTAYEVAFGRNRNNNIAIQATSAEDLPLAMDEVVATLRRLRGLGPQDENDFELFSNDTSAEMFDNLARMVGAATFGVCALALLVGGIGVMNIMLVSVTERTREIGVRMALGARRGRILMQFLLESITLSGLGGLVGVLVGAGLALGARTVFDVPASIPAWAVILSLASACGAGLLFGIYPAARASKLDPVEAMRIE